MKKTWFIAAVALQALVLLAMAGTSFAAEKLGREIRLQTVPVDPRDMLYGDYVTLSYEMSRMSPAMWKGEGTLPEPGDAVYVALAPNGGVYSPIGAYPEQVSIPEDQVLLKGIVVYSWGEEFSVRYGLERYYVPEGTGLRLEQSAGQLIVVAKVAPWGQTVITEVQEKP